MALVSQLLRLPPELKLEIDTAAEAAGLSSSEWLRQAAKASLRHRGAAAHQAAPEAGQPAVGDRRLHLRASACDISRWETEALEHGLTLNRYVQLQMSVTPERGRRVAKAVEILGTASVQVARIGRNLNQVARSVNIMPGQTTVSQRRMLMETCAAVDVFADQITAVCEALNRKLGRRRAKSVRDGGDGVVTA